MESQCARSRAPESRHAPPSVDLGDDAEQRYLRRRDVTVQGVRDADQAVVVEIGAREGPVHVFEIRRESTHVQ